MKIRATKLLNNRRPETLGFEIELSVLSRLKRGESVEIQDDQAYSDLIAEGFAELDKETDNASAN